jgi:hypothetical protein
MSEALLEMVMDGQKWQRTMVVEEQKACRLKEARGCEEVWGRESSETK